MKNSKATTLQFESDFDFETANAQFKDDLTKEVVGMFISKNINQLSFSCHSKKNIFVYVHVFVKCIVEKVDSEEAQDSQGLQEEESRGDKYYDKAKCFFDNISSDLKPR